ncbi:FkbM family methyltransferase [Candidatus Pelagibacter sp.]|nr:FkbM family methyltransferase [Candidatus Pelagibacter sp.]
MIKNILYKVVLLLNIQKYKFKNLIKPLEINKNLKFIKKYFEKKELGFYIDVGCFHPIRFSNTLFLYKKGWSGLNLDISKKTIDLFNISRPRDLNLNYGIGDTNCEMEFYYNKDVFQSNTLNNQFKDYFLKKNTLKKKKIEVKTLAYLLEKYFPEKKIDLLDIDAEGFDYEVLKGIDFNKNIINLIMIEVHHFSKETIDKSIKIRNLLEQKGFTLVCGDYPGNCVFENKDLV